MSITSSIRNVLSKKNMDLVVGLLTILVTLWVIMYAIPSLFYNLFDTHMGNLLLLGIVVLTAMYNKSMALGMLILFIIIYRFSRMGMARDGFFL